MKKKSKCWYKTVARRQYINCSDLPFNTTEDEFQSPQGQAVRDEDVAKVETFCGIRMEIRDEARERRCERRLLFRAGWRFYNMLVGKLCEVIGRETYSS